MNVRIGDAADTQFLCGLLIGGWKREEKSGAFAGLGFVPDPATMPFNDFSAYGQSHSEAFIDLSIMQALKQQKHALGEFRIYTNAIIGDLDDQLI